MSDQSIPPKPTPPEQPSPEGLDETLCSPLDELCVRMLSLGAMGGCGGGTDHMKASEIKALLIPFFGLERVDRCTAVLCGANAEPIRAGVDSE
jgi:hypothetical protein